MNKDYERHKRKLKKKLAEQVRLGNIGKQAVILKQIADLDKRHIEALSSPLVETLKKYPDQTQTQAMAKIMECIVVADIDATMAYETISHFRKTFGLYDIPILSRLREIAEQYDVIIKTIDEVGREIFSFTYMDIVEEAKLKCGSVVSNTVSKLIQERINSKVQ